jgi:hypothetical protein
MSLFRLEVPKGSLVETLKSNGAPRRLLELSCIPCPPPQAWPSPSCPLSHSHAHCCLSISLSLSLSLFLIHTHSLKLRAAGFVTFFGQAYTLKGPGMGGEGRRITMQLQQIRFASADPSACSCMHACLLEACSMPPRIACPGLQCSPRPHIACALALILTCAWTVTIRGGARHVLFVYGAPPKSAVSLKPQPINHVQAAGDTKVGTTHLCDLCRAHLTMRRHCVIERDGYPGRVLTALSAGSSC